MLADFHVHSGYSDDSDYPMGKVVKDALRLNLDAICFTEHVDYGVKPDWNHPEDARFESGHPVTNCPYPAYFDELERMRERYAGRIAVGRGLELGVQVHTIPQNNAVVERWHDQIDFVICSIHEVDDLEFWTGEFQAGRTQEEYNLRYYEEMLAVVEAYDGYSVLGHLDLIRRYDPAGPYPFEKVRDITAAILERVITDDKGIEVNTSGFRYGLGEPQPTADVLRLYHDLGGTIVTIGSDSHKPSDLGAYLRVAQDELASLGFESFCTYESWEPVFRPLS